MAMVYISMTIIIVIASLSWVIGLDHMHRNEPDYNGEDLFESDERIKQNGKIQEDNQRV